MPKRFLTIRDWSGGTNNRKDPRDVQDNESSFIQNMSIDALGKLKTSGALYAHSEDTDGSTNLSEYFVERAATLAGAGGYGLFYFESDHSRDSTYTITDTKHSGTSNDLTLGSSVGNIKFVAKQVGGDTTTTAPEYDPE
jgi:hypothetical protein